MKVIKYNEIYYEVFTTEEDFKDNKNNIAIILDDDSIYIYKGCIDELIDGETYEDGIYMLDKDNSLIIVGESVATKNDIIEKDNSVIEVLKNATNLADKINSKKVSISKTKKPRVKKEKKKLEGPRRNKNEVIQMSIEPEDNLLVRVLKEKINENKMTMMEIYNLVGNSKGYNLFYGLSTRNNLEWDTFCTWCKVLNVEPKLSVVDIVEE